MAQDKSSAVLRANLGLYLDRPPLNVPARGLTACNNVRINGGEITNQGIGWDKFTVAQLNGPVTLIDNYFLRTGAQILLFGSTKDLYRYDETTDTVAYISPIYVAGTADPTNSSAVVVGGTAWDTNLKAGDEMFFGSATETDPLATGNGGWYGIATVDSAVQVTLTANYTGTGGAQAYTGRKLFTGDELDYWRAETFPKAQPADKDLWYATNGVDDIVQFDSADTQVTLLDTIGFKCKELLRFKNMMVYGNIVLDSGEARPFSIKNSDIGAPTTFAIEGAEFVAHDGLDPVNGLYLLGDILVVYGQRTITLTQFVGSPLIFVFRSAISGLGPLAGRLVADFGDFHEFVGPDAGYKFDGVGLIETGFQVWRNTLRQQDPSRLPLGHSHFDEERGLVLWALPLTTDPNSLQTESALLEHYVEDIGPRDPVPFTKQNFRSTATGFFERQSTLRFDDITTSWATQSFRWNDQFFQAAFPFNLFGDANGFIYTLGTGDTFNTAAIESFARFSRRAAVDERRKGVVKRVYPFAERLPGASSYNLSVIVWGTDQAAGDLTNKGQFAYDLTHTGNRFVTPRVSGRFFEIEFATTGTNQIWTLQGYDTDVAIMGER